MILGLWDGHDAGAALVDASGRRIVCAVNEERFSRRKLEVGFPVRSIETVLREGGIGPGEVDEVALSTYDPAKTLTRWFPSLKEAYYLLRRRKVRPRRLDPVRRRFKYELTTWRPNRLSRRLSELALSRELERLGLARTKLRLVRHHMAHAATAAFASGYDSALVVTLDGVGDGLSGTLSKLENGRLLAVSTLAARHSLGIFYELVTRLLNMRELEDEGKVMALAAYGYPPSNGVNPLMDVFDVDGVDLKCRLSPSRLESFLAAELALVPTEQFAFFTQQVVETKVVELVRNALRRTGLTRIAYAGGVASNIQANRKLRELPECEEMFVFPHMGDGGLALGAALARAAEIGGGGGWFPLGDLRLGPGLVPGEVESALRASGLSFRKLPCAPTETARRLASGQIVFWFQGRMEYGPRALGGRSILGRPDREELRDRLNFELKRRVWYQPFCPSILDDEAKRLLEGGDVPNRYMTMAYRVRPEARESLRGVLGRDGTCRPQMVDESYGAYYRLLVAMKDEVGVGAVLNTSFNLHGEPMVARPAEAIDCFVRSGADALVMEDFLVERPEGAVQ
jgi:carbamoyltransferase